jgi:hypothetical protein
MVAMVAAAAVTAADAAARAHLFSGFTGCYVGSTSIGATAAFYRKKSTGSIAEIRKHHDCSILSNADPSSECWRHVWKPAAATIFDAAACFRRTIIARRRSHHGRTGQLTTFTRPTSSSHA